MFQTFKHWKNCQPILVRKFSSDSLLTEALMSQQTQELIGDFMNCDFPSLETGVDEPVQS